MVETIVLRRLQDSYVNISQLLSILVSVNFFTAAQLNGFLRNEVTDSLEYQGSAKSVRFEDHSFHSNPLVRGIWIPYDRAVALARKFDVFEFTKPLFLVDVHDFDRLPTTSVPALGQFPTYTESEGSAASYMTGSPAKRQNPPRENTCDSLAEMLSNPNHPFTLTPVRYEHIDADIEANFKSKFGEIIRQSDASEMSIEEIKSQLGPFSKQNPSMVFDIALDQRSLTALHFALTLASANLVQVLLEEKLNSVFRGNADGESALILVINVTNLMQRGNFLQLLSSWLHPQLWLLDNKKWTFLHHIVSASIVSSRAEAAKYYLKKIMEYLAANSPRLSRFIKEIVNAQDQQHGNTSLHIAAELESRWLVKILLLLKANTNIANHSGIRPIDLDIVKDITQTEYSDEFSEHIFDYISTSVDFLDETISIAGDGCKSEDTESGFQNMGFPPTSVREGKQSSLKIFESIHELLIDTNAEYTTIIGRKRTDAEELYLALHDILITTANNRFMTKTIARKLVELDKTKLQIANLADKLLCMNEQRENPNHPNAPLKSLGADSLDADSKYIIRSLYEKIADPEFTDDLVSDPTFIGSLPSPSVLRARIDAYDKVNSQLEHDINALQDCSGLTMKFKKVVSMCTNVDIDAVDELLDGLLEAVNEQHQ